MKLKNAILTSAIVLVATSAQAADINSPFYLPTKGKMLSETALEYKRANFDGGNYSNGWHAKQELSYGVTDNMSVFAAIGNTFDNNYADYMSVEYNNSHNFDYTVGLKYNKQFNNVLTQFKANYNTYKLDSFFSNEDVNNWEKNFTLGAKVGYEMTNGFLPYISFDAKYVLNTASESDNYLSAINELDSALENNWIYTTYAGAYKNFGKFSTDTGIKWVHTKDGFANKNFETKSRDEVYAQAQVNYNLSDTMSVGLYGDYMIGATSMTYIDYVYSLGANFKIAF